VQDGKDGVLVPPADPDALARAICDLLADPHRRSQLSTEAKKTAFQKFDPNRSAEQLTSIYQSVVDERRKTAGS